MKKSIMVCLAVSLLMVSMPIVCKFTEEGYKWRQEEEKRLYNEAHKSASEYTMMRTPGYWDKIVAGDFGPEAQYNAKEHNKMRDLDMRA